MYNICGERGGGGKRPPSCFVFLLVLFFVPSRVSLPPEEEEAKNMGGEGEKRDHLLLLFFWPNATGKHTPFRVTCVPLSFEHVRTYSTMGLLSLGEPGVGGREIISGLEADAGALPKPPKNVSQAQMSSTAYNDVLLGRGR